MTTYRPEMWVVLEIKYQTQTIYKILTTSYGGYTQGDSWKLSSGIESLSIEGDDYVMPNSSGSIYYCPKNLIFCIFAFQSLLILEIPYDRFLSFTFAYTILTSRWCF